MFFVLICAVLGILLLRFQLHKAKLDRRLGHIETTKNQYPLIGVAHRFYGRDTRQIMEQLIELGNEMETPSRFWFGPVHVFLIKKAEDMQAVLTSPNCLQKSYVYEFFETGLGLFSSPAHLWKPSRKLINPAFNKKIIQSFVPIFNEKINIMVKNLETKANTGESFNIAKYIFACTLDMICATSLGYNVEVQNDKNQSFLNGVETLSAMVAYRMFNLWLHPGFVYRRTQHNRIFQKVKATLKKLPKEIRITKEQEFENDKTFMEKLDNEEESYKTPQIFINELFKLYKSGKIDSDSVDDQVLTMLIGGNETSALTTSHVILMLAIFPDIQERVYQEIRNVYSVQESDSNIDQITKLEYTEMVIKETMRLFSVGPFLGRECMADTEIRPNVVIPKDTLILLCFYNLHLDPKVWGPEPHKFNPDHFLPEKVKNRHPYSYLPFSGGPRNCIGINYAWVSVKILLAALVRKYKFSTDIKFDEIKKKWDITMKLVQPHMVKIESRTDF